MDIKTSWKLELFAKIFSATACLGLILFAVFAQAAYQYPPAALLQPGDITSTMIRDATIVNADISNSANISFYKLKDATTAGLIPFFNGTRLATSTGLSFATTTPKLTITGALSVSASTTFNAVEYKWPAADGSGGQALKTSGAGVLSWGSVGLGFTVDTGVANNYVLAPAAAASSYAVGDFYLWQATNANTGSSTLNVSSLGATDLYKKSGVPLASGDIAAGYMVMAAVNSKTGVLVDRYSENNADSVVVGMDSTGALAAGQSFTVATTTTLTTVIFNLAKIGAPTGNMYAKLYAHSGTYGASSIPTGNALATSTASDVSTMTTSYALRTFTFTGANQYTLTPGNYVIAVEYSGGDVNNEVGVKVDQSTPSHSGNYFWKENSGTLTYVAGYDFPFHMGGTQNIFQMLSQVAN